MKADAQRRGVEAQENPVAPKIPGAPDEDEEEN
jgi:hypothetical protein